MKRLALALAAGTALLAAGAAHASDVHWSIGIATPPVATVFSNGPVYAPAPVYPVYGAAPVYEAAPVIVEPPVVYRSWHRPRYIVERPVVVGPRWGGGWHRGHHAPAHHDGHRRHHW